MSAPPASSSPPCKALLSKFLLNWDGWALGKHLVVGGGPRRPLMLTVAFDRGTLKEVNGVLLSTLQYGKEVPQKQVSNT